MVSKVNLSMKILSPQDKRRKLKPGSNSAHSCVASPPKPRRILRQVSHQGSECLCAVGIASITFRHSHRFLKITHSHTVYPRIFKQFLFCIILIFVKIKPDIFICISVISVDADLVLFVFINKVYITADSHRKFFINNAKQYRYRALYAFGFKKQHIFIVPCSDVHILN